MSGPVSCDKSFRTRIANTFYSHTLACDFTLRHHVLHPEGVKDTRLPLCVKISHMQTHTQQENTQNEAISSGIAVAANVLNSACLP